MASSSSLPLRKDLDVPADASAGHDGRSGDSPQPKPGNAGVWLPAPGAGIAPAALRFCQAIINAELGLPNHYPRSERPGCGFRFEGLEMSNDIVLSAGIRQNLLSLQNTSSLQERTQTRLATGKKVNSALDNAVNFFTAAALTNRSTELSSLLDSMTNGVNTLKAADNGLTSITTTIQSMQATVTQARQDGSWQSSSYTIDSANISTTALKQIVFS